MVRKTAIALREMTSIKEPSAGERPIQIVFG